MKHELKDFLESVAATITEIVVLLFILYAIGSAVHHV